MLLKVNKRRCFNNQAQAFHLWDFQVSSPRSVSGHTDSDRNAPSSIRCSPRTTRYDATRWQRYAFSSICAERRSAKHACWTSFCASARLPSEFPASISTWRVRYQSAAKPTKPAGPARRSWSTWPGSRSSSWLQLGSASGTWYEQTIGSI